MVYHKIYYIPEIILWYIILMKELTKSLGNYLLAIYELVEENNAARVRDVSQKMNIGAASTSEAVKLLAKKEYINYRPYGLITLTSKGSLAARKKIERHKTIENFLTSVLWVDKNYADELEYSMPDEVLEKFVGYLTFMQNCSCKEPKWIKSFQHYIKEGKMQSKCIECMRNGSSCCNGCKT